MLFIIVNIAYVVLPFCFAMLHYKLSTQKFNLTRLSFVYFLFFNVFLKAVPIGISAVSLGHSMASENGWVFSPMFAQYGITIGTMGLMGVFAVFIKGGFRLATALMFALFSIFAGTLHIVQMAQGVPLTSHNPIVLIIFDFITAITLLYFIFNKNIRGDL